MAHIIGNFLLAIDYNDFWCYQRCSKVDSKLRFRGDYHQQTEF